MRFVSRWTPLAALLLASAAVAAERAAVSRPAVTPAPRRVDNAVLHVEVSGAGRPILLIPGLASSGDVYAGAVARWGGRYETHVVTLGGFAGRPRFEGPFLATARESLLAYVKARKLERPIVVGHSLGGVLALDMAIAAPDAIGPVVVFDALPFLGGAGRPEATAESVRAQMEPLRAMIAAQSQEQYAAFQRQAPHLRGMVTRDEDHARVLDWAVTSDPAAVAAGMFDVATTDLREGVAKIRSPLLVLGSWYGLRSVSTREAVEQTFRTQFAKAPRWTFASADSARHFLMLDDPEWTWSRVDAFLDTAAVAPASAGGAR